MIKTNYRIYASFVDMNIPHGEVHTFMHSRIRQINLIPSNYTELETVSTPGKSGTPQHSRSASFRVCWGFLSATK
jgi:hypothetical protein